MNYRHPYFSRRLAQLALVVASLVIALALVEIVLRAFWPLADPHANWRHGYAFIRSQHAPLINMRITPEPGLPGVSGVNRFTTNNMGFRGSDVTNPKPINEYRVFLIGGSTMECLVLDDEDSIDAVLEKHLDNIQKERGRVVKVYNAGKSGDRSDDHVALLSQRLVHLEPDLIVVFAGINDLRVAVANHDYLHLGGNRINAWSLAITELQIGRVLYYLYKRRPPQREFGEDHIFETPYGVSARALQSATPAAGQPPVSTRGYANNLKTITGIANAHGIHIVFMTQQTTWASETDPYISDWHWLLSVEGTVYNEMDMHLTMELFNDEMRAIAEDLNVALYDVAEVLPKASSHFYDDVHFNERGARDAAFGLAATISAQGWLTD